MFTVTKAVIFETFKIIGTRITFIVPWSDFTLEAAVVIAVTALGVWFKLAVLVTARVIAQSSVRTCVTFFTIFDAIIAAVG